MEMRVSPPLPLRSSAFYWWLTEALLFVYPGGFQRPQSPAEPDGDRLPENRRLFWFFIHRTYAWEVVVVVVVVVPGGGLNKEELSFRGAAFSPRVSE